MPRLDPRQRLIREALLTGAAGVVVLAAAAWWAFSTPAKPQALTERTATVAAAASVPAPPPSANLWRPFSDAPEVATASAPPPPPNLRLISLSRRDERWTALIDPGDGSGSQRVTGGEQVAGWQVDTVGQDTVELSSDGRRHQLRFSP